MKKSFLCFAILSVFCFMGFAQQTTSNAGLTVAEERIRTGEEGEAAI